MPIISSIGTVLGFLGEAVHYGPAVLTFIHSTVTAVEATGKSGADKLTAVLNAVGVFASAILPSEAAVIQSFMTAVEALVNDLVALWNEAGVFLHGPAPVAA
jgi:hypothetical protein